MNIPDAAVEAAARAAHVSKLTGVRWDDVPKWRRSERLSEARAALEAAAPHLMAEAWEAGMTAAKLQAAGIKQARNPYRPAGADA